MKTNDRTRLAVWLAICKMDGCCDKWKKIHSSKWWSVLCLVYLQPLHTTFNHQRTFVFFSLSTASVISDFQIDICSKRLANYGYHWEHQKWFHETVVILWHKQLWSWYRSMIYWTFSTPVPFTWVFKWTVSHGFSSQTKLVDST